MKPLTIALALKANAELKIQKKEKPLFSPLKDWRAPMGHFLEDQSQSTIQRAMPSETFEGPWKLSRIIKTLGEKWYRNALQDIFGFGMRTRSSCPSESPGVLPTPEKFILMGKWNGRFPPLFPSLLVITFLSTACK